MELVTIKAKTRGKTTREVEYKGVGKFVEDKSTEKQKDKDGKEIEVEVIDRHLVTAGVVTDIKDALSVEGGDMQSLLDNWAIGFNLAAYKSVSDALSEYINPLWSAEQVGIFRLAVNNLVKLGIAIEAAVEMAKNSPALKSA